MRIEALIHSDLRVCATEIGNSGGRHLRLPQVNLAQLRERGERSETRVGDSCAVEIEVFELHEARECGDSGIGDGIQLETQLGEVFEAAERFHLCVSDACAPQIQDAELARKLAERGEASSVMGLVDV